MIRKFHSAPTRLSLAKLDVCLDRVNQLATRVDKLTSETVKVRSRSLADIRGLSAPGINLSGSNLIMEDDQTGEKQPGTRPRTCHKCHCPLNDPRHAGVQSGVDNCTLDHWSGCPGDKQGGQDPNGRPWAACPSLSEAYQLESLERKDEEVFSNASTLPATLEDAVKLIENLNIGVHKDVSSSSVSSGDSSDDEELRIQQEEIEKLKLDMAKMAKEKKRADKKEKKRLEM